MSKSKRCHHLLDQLSDYIEGELAEALCTELEHHLATCPDCRVVVDTTRKTVSLYRRYGPAELPEGTAERLWVTLAQADLPPEGEA